MEDATALQAHPVAFCQRSDDVPNGIHDALQIMDAEVQLMRQLKYQMEQLIRKSLLFAQGELRSCWLEVVGSVAWNGDVPQSDLDLMLCTPQRDSDNATAISLLQELSNSIAKQTAHKDIRLELFSTAKVPILQVRDGSCCCDIAVDQLRSIQHCCFLMKALDGRPQVRVFLQLVKYWLRQRGLPLTADGGLPAIAWVFTALSLASQQPEGSSLEVLLVHFFSEMHRVGTPFLDIRVAGSMLQALWKEGWITTWSTEWTEIFRVTDPAPVYSTTSPAAEDVCITPPSLPTSLGLLYVAELRMAWNAIRQGQWHKVWSPASHELKMNLPLACLQHFQNKRTMHVILKDGEIFAGDLQGTRPCPGLPLTEVLHRRDQSSVLQLRLCGLTNDQGTYGHGQVVTFQPCHWICTLPEQELRMLQGEGLSRLVEISQMVGMSRLHINLQKLIVALKPDVLDSAPKMTVMCRPNVNGRATPANNRRHCGRAAVADSTQGNLSSWMTAPRGTVFRSQSDSTEKEHMLLTPARPVGHCGRAAVADSTQGNLSKCMTAPRGTVFRSQSDSSDKEDMRTNLQESSNVQDYSKLSGFLYGSCESQQDTMQTNRQISGSSPYFMKSSRKGQSRRPIFARDLLNEQPEHGESTTLMLTPQMLQKAYRTLSSDLHSLSDEASTRASEKSESCRGDESPRRDETPRSTIWSITESDMCKSRTSSFGQAKIPWSDISENEYIEWTDDWHIAEASQQVEKAPATVTPQDFTRAIQEGQDLGADMASLLAEKANCRVICKDSESVLAPAPSAFHPASSRRAAWIDMVDEPQGEPQPVFAINDAETAPSNNTAEALSDTSISLVIDSAEKLDACTKMRDSHKASIEFQELDGSAMEAHSQEIHKPAIEAFEQLASCKHMPQEHNEPMQSQVRSAQAADVVKKLPKKGKEHTNNSQAKNIVQFGGSSNSRDVASVQADEPKKCETHLSASVDCDVDASLGNSSTTTTYSWQGPLRSALSAQARSEEIKGDAAASLGDRTTRLASPKSMSSAPLAADKSEVVCPASVTRKGNAKRGNAKGHHTHSRQSGNGGSPNRQVLIVEDESLISTDIPIAFTDFFSSPEFVQWRRVLFVLAAIVMLVTVAIGFPLAEVWFPRIR